jgi:hypothetical protein
MKKSELKGKKFLAKRILNGLSIEDIPAIRKNLKSQIANIPEAEMIETETAFELNNGQFFRKPKEPKEKEGLLDCRPSFAKFENCRIEYKNMAIKGNTIETEFAQYEIINEV